MSEYRNLASRAAQPMIGHRAGERKTAFDDVKPIHHLPGRTDSASRRKAAHRSEIALTAIEKIAVQCDDHIRTFEFWGEAEVVAEGRLGGKSLRVAKKRIVSTPAQARVNFFQFAAQ